MSCMRPDKLIQLDRILLKHRTEDVAKEDISCGKKEGVTWRVGEMMFEAHIRMLDDMVSHFLIYLILQILLEIFCRDIVQDTHIATPLWFNQSPGSKVRWKYLLLLWVTLLI